MDERGMNYIYYARQLTASGSYNKAFDFYMMAFRKNPRLKPLYEIEYQTVVFKFNDVLSSAGRIEEVFANFGKAIKIFPENILLLNGIGKYLYKYGFFSEAWSHFQRALKIDPGLVSPEKNLNSVKNILVERWHFRMLNDKVRNELYRTAIHESIIPNKESVIDIGTGTGLLSLFAHECKPAAITACDGSEAMMEMAENVAKDMGINDIVFINEMSTSMSIQDIGGKCSLLVTEMFDAGLLGEQALPAIAHAWAYLMNSSGRVVPCQAEFFVCAAVCDELNLKYQLGETAKTFLNVSDVNVHTLTFNETYDCEDVNFFKDLKYITNPESLLKIDFNSYNDVVDKLQNREPYTVELKALENGIANVMIGWFNLQLTENISLTTDPRSPNRCNAWQQAVFYDFIPQSVQNNDTITSEFFTTEGRFTMLTENNSYIHRISPESVRFLNDSDYMKMIMGCTSMACVYLGQIIEISKINVVDLCPFPVFGIQMLKRGAESLICNAKTYNDEEFILHVMRANNIPLSKLTVLSGSQWTLDCFADYQYHAIFCNPFELCGELDLKYKLLAQKLKNLHMFPGGLFMPSNITLMGQITDCPWLDINNQVNDENVCNYEIAKYMNKYQVSQNFSINISHLEYAPLTEPTCLGIYNIDFDAEVVNVPVISNGSANALLCWYKIEIMENLGEISTNRSNSFIDSTAFLANPRVPMQKGNNANVIRCVDPDGSFKFVIDVDAPA